MEYKLFWSDRARLHLMHIENYIAEDSPFQAKKVVHEIIDHAENLKIFPEMGHIVPDFPHLGLRQLIKYSYRIIYSFSGNRVTIVAIVHGKQKYIEMYLHE